MTRVADKALEHSKPVLPDIKRSGGTTDVYLIVSRCPPADAMKYKSLVCEPCTLSTRHFSGC